MKYILFCCMVALFFTGCATPAPLTPEKTPETIVEEIDAPMN